MDKNAIEVGQKERYFWSNQAALHKVYLIRKIS